MKLSKFASLVKKYGECIAIHAPGGKLWLGTAGALYQADGLPEVEGDDQIRAVLDIPSKAWEKIYFEEKWEHNAENVLGLNLEDYMAGEQETERLRVCAALGGVLYACRRGKKDREVLFYNEALLAPISDAIRESEYIAFTMRRDQNGRKYLAVHDGMHVLAIIMEEDVLTEDYLADLSDFNTMCVEQFCAGRKQREEDEE